MRHKIKGRRLSRRASLRKALLKGLAKALVQHRRIRTTVPKAKELRMHIEPMVTKAIKGHLLEKKAAESQDEAEAKQLKVQALHYRRLLISLLGDRHLVDILITKIAPKFTERPGGYTRIYKLSQKRPSDDAKMALIEFVGLFDVEGADAIDDDEDTDTNTNEAETAEKKD